MTDEFPDAATQQGTTLNVFGPSSAPRQLPRATAGAFHIPSLDGIRAISFLLVFVSHVGFGHLVPGGLGVTVFFFLSGYLITTLLRLERDRTSRNSLRDFYVRRAFRILPPFYTVLTLAVLLTLLGLLQGTLHASSVLSQAAHICNYWMIFADRNGYPAGTVVYWSLAVEEHFYFVFPALFVLLQRTFPRRPRVQAGLLLGLCACVLAWRLLLVLCFHVEEIRITFASDTRIDSILWGCVLALLGNPMLDAPRGSARQWKRIIVPAALALLAGSLIFRASWFRDTLRYTLQGLALIPLFSAAIRFPEWGAMRWLNHPWVARLGVWSYSLYLSHQVVLALLHDGFPAIPLPVLALPALVSCLLMAAAIERWVERPAARARKAYVSTAWLNAGPAVGAAAASRAR